MLSSLLARLFGRRAGPSDPPAARPPVEGDVDLLVREAFFPDPAYRGLMIEVGAAKPDFLSIGATFRRAGWTLIAIEPNPVFCALQRDQGVDVIECACGDRDEDDVPFFIVDSDARYLGEAVTHESFSSLGIRGKFADLMKTVPTEMCEVQVRLRRLDTILAERGIAPAKVDILSIDVEGWELEVLAGLNGAVPGPRLMIVENVFDEQRYVDEICARGYRLWRRVYPNDVFVRHDVAEPGPQVPSATSR